MKNVTLATFNDPDPAIPVLQRLQQAGFHPKLQDESKWQRYHFTERLASVKLLVDESELEPARQQLEAWDAAEHCLEQAVCCPECGSSDVDYPQVTRKFVMPTLAAILYRLGWAEAEFICNTCQHTWPRRVKIEPERNALNWPIKNSRRRENTDTTP
jgi:hypothetical protein